MTIETIIQDIEKPFEKSVQLIKLIDAAFVDATPIKAAVLNLIKAGELAVSNGAALVASDGLNVPADVAEVTDIVSFFTYFKSTFLPLALVEYNLLDAAAKA
jgi:hypothetical protein